MPNQDSAVTSALAAGTAHPASSTVAGTTSNPHPESNVNVHVATTALDWEVQENLYGDQLPIIPTGSNVQGGKILYRLKIKLTLHTVSDGVPAAGKSVSVQSSNAGDTVSLSPAVSDASGIVTLTLESRTAGDRHLSVTNSNITATPLAITLKDAWYESGFHITHYIIADEHDANGPMAQAAGVAGQHRHDFLYGARGVPMQGTGQTLDNQFVRFDGGGGGWHNNAQGHPDVLNNPATAHLHTTDAAHGHYADVVAGQSVAIDPTVIPPRAKIYIVSADGSRVVGERHADDTGGGIHSYHIDHFSGAGSAATHQWTASGGDLTNARVKFIGQ